MFVDDFVGTGDSVCGYLSALSGEVREKLVSRDLRAFLVVVAGFVSAVERVNRTVSELEVPIKVHVCDPLDESYHCFGERSRIFPSEAERLAARDLAYRKGVMLCKQAPLGWGGSQSTVVFSHNCPNNALPILWDQNEHWHPLFRRN